MTKNDFAVIVPAFNEAEVIPDLVRELREAFERFGLDGEVILVDDGCHRGTRVGWVGRLQGCKAQ